MHRPTASMFANADLKLQYTDESDSLASLPSRPSTRSSRGSRASRVSYPNPLDLEPKLILSAIPFEILNVWNNCNTVTLRWRSAQTPEIVSTHSIRRFDTIMAHQPRRLLESSYLRPTLYPAETSSRGRSRQYSLNSTVARGWSISGYSSHRTALHSTDARSVV